MGGKHSDRRNFCDSTVSVFFPPAVAVAVRFSAGKIAGPSRALLELGVWTLGINVLMLLILSAFYGYEGTDIGALSFGCFFAVKYILLSSALSLLLALISLSPPVGTGRKTGGEKSRTR